MEALETFLNLPDPPPPSPHELHARALVVATSGRNLRELRTAAGFSQTELAAAVGVKQPTIAQIEKGIRKSSPEVALRIYKALVPELAESLPSCTCAATA